jgi:putative spermidine/putrescine transport system ATP-binding protein
MTKLSIDHVTKSYAGKTVLDDVCIDVPDGQFVSLLGPSGCGKTTTLNIVAGFLSPDAGAVRLGEKDVTKAPPYRRDTAVVFQNYALFPHMKVVDNVSYGLRARKVPKSEIRPRTEEALRLVGIEEFGDRYPAQLSGGQQQRVAVARSVVVRPGVLLMDEPLSNLDAKLRAEIRIELRALQRNLQQTVLFVTHDQEEALSMSDLIVLMNGGRIEQMGSPNELFEKPATVFAARFLGVENILECSSSAGPWTGPGGMRLPVKGGASPAHVGIRPSRLELVPREDPRTTDAAASIPVRVVERAYLGTSVRYVVRCDDTTLISVMPSAAAVFEDGSDVSARVSADAILSLETRTPTTPALP